MTGISFPFQAPSADGELVDVVPGVVKWLRMPLPMALDHINLYLVRDGAGWRLVDTGMDTSRARALWEGILPRLDGPITGIICTHYHSDHSGLAAWLTDRLHVPLYMTRAEYFGMRLFAQPSSFESWEYREFFTRAGLDEAEFQKMAASVRQIRRQAPPRAYQRLRDGQALAIGAHTWQVCTGEGHSPEHASLHCEELGVLISGDQLLARISPNVGVLPFEPEANPIRDWFASLRKIGRLPAGSLVLPAHELPFYGLEQRSQELEQHHLDQLETLHALCLERADSVHGLAGRLFPVRRGALDHILAISETLAHLAYLLDQGRLTRTLTDRGVHEYQAREAADR